MVFLNLTFPEMKTTPHPRGKVCAVALCRTKGAKARGGAE
jgi:hypothetical protein